MSVDTENRRLDFLLAMYNQLMNDINRHIVVVWQAIAALGASIAALSLVKDDVVPLGYSVALVVVVVIWLQLHVLDASYWYNRNLAMIANIEKIFLVSSDVRDVHYYFGKHRPNNNMISHLRIQSWLGYGVALIFLSYLFYDKIFAIFNLKQWEKIEFSFVLPWVIALIGAVLIFRENRRNKSKYNEFLENSPGTAVEIPVGVTYGEGHGFGRNSS